MVLKDNNIPLITFEPRDIDGFKLTTALMKDMITEASKYSIPVVLRVGAIDFKMGSINTIRIGRDEAFADVDLTLKGELELEPIHNDNGKVVGAKPTKYVYSKIK